MFRARLSDFTVAGWALIVVSLGACIAVAVPLGALIYAKVDHAFFRENRAWLCVVCALPGLGVSIAAYMTGARVLRRYGVRVIRERRALDALPQESGPLDVRALLRDESDPPRGK